MNNTSPLLTLFSIALAATSLAIAVVGNSAMAQDKAKPAAAAAPAKEAAKADAKDQRDRKVLVENDKVLVTEITYKPGASSGMLPRGQRVTRVLTGGTLERTYADGRKETRNLKAGEVFFSAKETFSQKNTGKSDVVLYTVTIK